MNGLIWREAREADLPDIALYLRRHETYCAGLSARLVDSDRLKLPNDSEGWLWLARSSGDSVDHEDSTGGARPVYGLVLMTSGGIILPLLPENPEFDEDLVAGIARSGHVPSQSVGLGRYVERLTSSLGLRVREAVVYDLMRFRRGTFLPLDAHADPVGILVRQARLSDFESMVPVQEAYEREEVLTSIHRPDPVFLRRHVFRILREHRVYVAVHEGRIVGKAQTNARGIAVDQIGGIYTLPGFRGRGIARSLVMHLAAEITGEDRDVVLFVRSANTEAVRLYEKTGFSRIDGYRVDYY